MYHMNLFDVNAKILKFTSPFADFNNEISTEETEEKVDTVTFTDVKAREFNRKVYKTQQTPEIDVIFSELSRKSIMEQIQKQKRQDIYGDKPNSFDTVLEEFAKMEITPSMKKDVFRLGFQSHLASRPSFSNQEFESADLLTSITPEARKALKDKIEAFTKTQGDNDLNLLNPSIYIPPIDE
jgi:hypothetical protein